jgi:hypothetical protein
MVANKVALDCMTEEEIKTASKRHQIFSKLRNCDELIDTLLKRDREVLDMIMCVECAHIQKSSSGWQCSNAIKAKVSTNPKDHVPRQFVFMLQRCPGFKERKND